MKCELCGRELPRDNEFFEYCRKCWNLNFPEAAEYVGSRGPITTEIHTGKALESEVFYA